MDIAHRTVLVTGGATGIGFAIAERFAKAGSRVIVCGRRHDALRAAKEKISTLETIACDVGRAEDRVALVEQAIARFPELDVVVNNAGIQRRARILDDAAPWSERQQEIAINLEAPIHLCSLFLPHLRAKSDAAIVNVTSGLAFVPAVFAPVYAATKAAMHSFTVSLRHELSRATKIRVVEIVPPSVNTDLGGAGVHDQGVPLDVFADAVMERVAKGEDEVGYGFADNARKASRAELDAISARMAQAR
jgi:uncharacterized oxidoreductase